MFATKFTGFSFCHPAHDDDHIYNVVLHALSSVSATKTPTATFLLLPSQIGWTKKGYMQALRNHPHSATVLTKFPSESLTFQQPEVHLNQKLAPQKNQKHMQLVVIWNNEGKQALFHNNPRWLEHLSSAIPGVWCYNTDMHLANMHSPNPPLRTPNSWHKTFQLLLPKNVNITENTAHNSNIITNMCISTLTT